MRATLGALKKSVSSPKSANKGIGSKDTHISWGTDTGMTSLQGNWQCPANFYTYKCFAPATPPLEEGVGSLAAHPCVGRRTYSQGYYGSTGFGSRKLEMTCLSIHKGVATYIMLFPSNGMIFSH